MRLYTMFMMGNGNNQKIKKNAEHRFAGNQKVPTKKNEESKNSNGPEWSQYDYDSLQYEDIDNFSDLLTFSSDDSD